MKISSFVTGAALAAMLAAAVSPAPAAAQLGALKRRLKEKVAEKVIEKVMGTPDAQGDTSAVGGAATGSGGSEVVARTNGNLVAKKGMPEAPAQPGPHFSEYLLEITPEVLGSFEKGMVAELAVQREIDGLIGRQLAAVAYTECRQKAMSSPAAQQIYLEAGDLIKGDASQEQLQKASRELAKRFDKLIQPLCGMDPQQAQAIRDQYRDRLDAAAPLASGLTALQLSLMKERIIPLCAALDALSVVAGEARVPTSASAIYWVYTQREVAALQPRCAQLAAALKRGA